MQRVHMAPSGYVDSSKHPDAIAIDEMQIDALVGAGATRILYQLSGTSHHKCLRCESCCTIQELCSQNEDYGVAIKQVPPGLANWLMEMAIAGIRVRCTDF